ncbi:unnamed protein product [Prunus brigantina]
MPRICRGRQKLQMVKMENETNLQVTFSKRRAGLFKKASELSTLCGTELGLIVFSPGKKAFCFGHPSIEEVLDKYEGRTSHQPLNHDMQQIVEACSHATTNELNDELTQVMERIERERKRGEELTQLLKASQAECGLGGPVEELDLDRMEILRASLMQLRSKVADQAKQKLAAAKTANPPHNPNVYAGSSSSSAAAQSANPPHNPNVYAGSSSFSAAAQSANPAHNNFCVGSSSSSAAAQSANPAHNNFFVGSSSSSAAAQSANPAHNNFFVGSSSSSVAAQSANPSHNNFFVGSSSSSAAAGPSGLQGLANPEINNVGFNFNGNDFVMQAPDQPNNFGFNFNGAEPVLQAPDQPNTLGFNFNGAEPVMQSPPDQPNNLGFNINRAEPVMQAPPDQRNYLGFNFNGPDQPNNLGFNNLGFNFNGPDQPNNLGFNFYGAEPVMQAPLDQPNNLGFNFNGPDQPNNLDFNFNGADSVMQAPPDQPNNVGFNGDPMFLSDWNPNLGGDFL